MRYGKSEWERKQIRAAFALADFAYDAMKAQIKPGASEIQVAAAGEFAARSRGASGFGFSAIVGSGARSNAVVPTASSKLLQEGEMAMIGIAPKVCGYAGVVGDALPVNGRCSQRQQACMQRLKEAFRLTKAQLLPGKIGKEIDAPARAYFETHGFSKYLVCPFVHTIGLHEAEAPFFGPHSDNVLKPGMTVCVDVSFFGHPEFNGVRIETGYEIADDGPLPLSRRWTPSSARTDFRNRRLIGNAIANQEDEMQGLCGCINRSRWNPASHSGAPRFVGSDVVLDRGQQRSAHATVTAMRNASMALGAGRQQNCNTFAKIRCVSEGGRQPRQYAIPPIVCSLSCKNLVTIGGSSEKSPETQLPLNQGLMTQGQQAERRGQDANNPRIPRENRGSRLKAVQNPVQSMHGKRCKTLTCWPSSGHGRRCPHRPARPFWR